MRAQQAWNVVTHASPAMPPVSRSIRSRISRAALLVNVIARICHAGTPVSSRCATRQVSARVLPEPAPASTSTGPCRVSTAWRCCGLRELQSIQHSSLRLSILFSTRP